MPTRMFEFNPTSRSVVPVVDEATWTERLDPDLMFAGFEGTVAGCAATSRAYKKTGYTVLLHRHDILICIPINADKACVAHAITTFVDDLDDVANPHG